MGKFFARFYNAVFLSNDEKQAKKVGLILLSIFCIVVVTAIILTRFNNSKDDSFVVADITETTEQQTAITTVEEIQGINALLSTTATGVDWLGATNEYKKIWCENSISAWDKMGYDISKLSVDEMIECVDIYYDDSNYLFDKLTTASLDYAKYFDAF